MNDIDFRLSLSEFRGTACYYYNELYKNLYYTEGVKFFFNNAGKGAYWFLSIVATEIIPKLKTEFYFIYLEVNNDKAKITVRLDKGQPVLYQKILTKTDCPSSNDEPYIFCLDMNDPNNTILCLLSEY